MAGLTEPVMRAVLAPSFLTMELAAVMVIRPFEQLVQPVSLPQVPPGHWFESLHGALLFDPPIHVVEPQ
jgi:hypothetical protein